MHRGVDLRSVDFTTWKDQNIIAPEECEVLRVGTDKIGNNFLVVRPFESHENGFRELKFIHICNHALNNFAHGQVLNKGDYIGVAIEGGSSKSKHLHFESWVEYTSNVIRPQNPVEYFLLMKIKYDYVEALK